MLKDGSIVTIKAIPGEELEFIFEETIDLDTIKPFIRKWFEELENIIPTQ